jgi:uncharacterized membrane protein
MVSASTLTTIAVTDGWISYRIAIQNHPATNIETINITSISMTIDVLILRHRPTVKRQKCIWPLVLRV